MQGVVSLEDISNFLSPHTALVTIMHSNNEVRICKASLTNTSSLRFQFLLNELRQDNTPTRLHNSNYPENSEYCEVSPPSYLRLWFEIIYYVIR